MSSEVTRAARLCGLQSGGQLGALLLSTMMVVAASFANPPVVDGHVQAGLEPKPVTVARPHPTAARASEALLQSTLAPTAAADADPSAWELAMSGCVVGEASSGADAARMQLRSCVASWRTDVQEMVLAREAAVSVQQSGDRDTAAASVKASGDSSDHEPRASATSESKRGALQPAGRRWLGNADPRSLGETESACNSSQPSDSESETVLELEGEHSVLSMANGGFRLEAVDDGRVNLRLHDVSNSSTADNDSDQDAAAPLVQGGCNVGKDVGTVVMTATPAGVDVAPDVNVRGGVTAGGHISSPNVDALEAAMATLVAADLVAVAASYTSLLASMRARYVAPGVERMVDVNEGGNTAESSASSVCARREFWAHSASAPYSIELLALRVVQDSYSNYGENGPTFELKLRRKYPRSQIFEYVGALWTDDVGHVNNVKAELQLARSTMDSDTGAGEEGMMATLSTPAELATLVFGGRTQMAVQSVLSLSLSQGAYVDVELCVYGHSGAWTPSHVAVDPNYATKFDTNSPSVLLAWPAAPEAPDALDVPAHFAPKRYFKSSDLPCAVALPNTRAVADAPCCTDAPATCA